MKKNTKAFIITGTIGVLLLFAFLFVWTAVSYQTASINTESAKVSIIGAGMIDRPGIASTMFKTLATSGINIRMISTSEIKISCLINKEDAQKAVKALHEVFQLECDEIADVKGTLPEDEL